MGMYTVNVRQFYQQGNTHTTTHRNTHTHALDREWPKRQCQVQGMVYVRSGRRRERATGLAGGQACGRVCWLPRFWIGRDTAAEFRTSGTTCAAFWNAHTHTDTWAYHQRYTTLKADPARYTQTQIVNNIPIIRWQMKGKTNNKACVSQVLQHVSSGQRHCPVSLSSKDIHHSFILMMKVASMSSFHVLSMSVKSCLIKTFRPPQIKNRLLTLVRSLLCFFYMIQNMMTLVIIFSINL